MPDGYTNDEVTGYVSNFLSEEASVSITKTGRRDVQSAWETLYANLTNALMLEPSAYFYLAYLASNRARGLAQQQLNRVDAIIAASSQTTRQVTALEDQDVTALVNAEAALLNLDSAIEQNSTGIKGSLGPQIKRFQDSVSDFVSNKLAPNVVRNQTLLPTREEAAATVSSQWLSAAATDAAITEILSRIQTALEDFEDLRLASTAVGRMVGRVRTRISTLQTDLVGRNGLALQRPAVVELLTSSDLIGRASNFKTPTSTKSPLLGEAGTATIISGASESVEAVSTEEGMYGTALVAASSLDFDVDGVSYTSPIPLPSAELLLDLNGWSSGMIYGGDDVTIDIQIQPNTTAAPYNQSALIPGGTNWADIQALVTHLNVQPSLSHLSFEEFNGNILMRTATATPTILAFTATSGITVSRGIHRFGGEALGLSLAEIDAGNQAAMPSVARSGADAVSVAADLQDQGIDAEAEVTREYSGAAVFASGSEDVLILAEERGDYSTASSGSGTIDVASDLPTGLAGQVFHFTGFPSEPYTITANTRKQLTVTPVMPADRSGAWAIGPDASSFAGEAFLSSGVVLDSGTTVDGLRIGFTPLAGAAITLDDDVSNTGDASLTIESRVLIVRHTLTSETSLLDITSGTDAGFVNGAVTVSAGRARLSEDVGNRDIEAGDPIVFTGALSHSATVVSVDADVVTFTPPATDPGAAADYTISSQQYIAYSALANSLSWTGTEFGTADAAVQRLIGGARYAAGVQTDIEGYQTALSQLILVLDTYTVRRYPSIQRLISMFDEQGFNRALDLLLSMRTQELLQASAEDVSYRTHLVRKLADTTRQVAPVHRYAKAEGGAREAGRGQLINGGYDPPNHRTRRTSR